VYRAFRAYEALERIPNIKVGCALVVTLMPAGALLDYFVYPEQLWAFLEVRLVCSVIAALIWVFLYSRLGQRSGSLLGVVVPMLPVVSIAWMISGTEGFGSPYYAGLNLVLLAVGSVLHWTVLESLVAVGLVLVIYVAAGILHGAGAKLGVLVNNFYFISLMDVIVVVGTYFQSRARFRQFALRFELDRNRQQLEESNRKLLELDQIKSRFFANVSHELRTPLTLLIAPLENLVNRFGRSFDDETHQLLQTMHANGMRLLKLINDLLDLVRLESGVMQVKREPVDLAEFVRGLASAARQVADDKRIRLETDVAPDVGRVLVDHDKLEKIILNLQFNALKFTPAGGRVDVRARRQENQLVLEVQDTGMGISEKNLANVFSRFWQADDSSRRKYQGMGIGLALVKELTEIQDGTVAVQSQEGKGTTFTVRLPYLKAEENAGAAAGAPEPEPIPSVGTLKRGTVSDTEWLAKLYRRAELFPAITAVRDALKPVETSGNGHLPKVLIADDEPDMLRFLKSQLQSHYQVIEAVDGQQAIEKANQFLPDIILLDMMMPEKDGLQACREIRERTPTRSIPVVLITARADEETKLAALSAGASDFLPKPFSTTELHVRVKNLVESYHYQNRLSRQNQALENTLEQLKETQTQLVQSEKLASLGRMSAGIIHEINNPLNFATTGLYTLRHKAPLIPEAQRSDYSEILHDVEEGISRVRTIVSDLRSFTHPDMAQVDEVPVLEVVSPALRFTSNLWKDKVAIVQALPDDQVLRVNRNKLMQVLVNLLQNSLDALKTKTFPAGEQPTIWIRGEVQDGWSRLTVRDNGQGISPEHLDKIFDPFFTTKDVGEGMGLGLSICYNIVREYGGQIRVRSEPGQFCEFTLEFPVKVVTSKP
jgi:signal transduction histidine kinase